MSFFLYRPPNPKSTLNLFIQALRRMLTRRLAISVLPNSLGLMKVKKCLPMWVNRYQAVLARKMKWLSRFMIVGMYSKFVPQTAVPSALILLSRVKPKYQVLISSNTTLRTRNKKAGIVPGLFDFHVCC